VVKRARHASEFIDRASVGVIGRFAVYFSVFAAIILAVDRIGGWHGLLLALTWLSATIAHVVGVSAAQSGTLIVLANRTLSIDLPCSAIFIVALYSALVLAYPVSPAQRLRGLALGIPVIAIFNVVRIVAAAQVALALPHAFDFFHDYLFQSGMVLVTAVVWASWLSLARRDAR
jgi:exosortase/archaeosortase family protein